jgi:hypothetical protein
LCVKYVLDIIYTIVFLPIATLLYLTIYNPEVYCVIFSLDIGSSKDL